MRSDSCDIGLNQSGTVMGERTFENREGPVRMGEMIDSAAIL
jgi:hypothetical protein